MKKFIIAAIAVTSLSLTQTVIAQEVPTISFAPSSGTFSVGETINVTINGDTAGRSVLGGAIAFDWNPALFEVTNIQKAAGSAFDLPTTSINNDTGRAQIAMLPPGFIPASYEGPMVTFTLEVQGVSGSAGLVFDDSVTRFANQNDTVTNDATYTTQAGQNDVPTVVISVPADATTNVPRSQTSILLSGSANDPDGTVDEVLVNVNGGGFVPASGTTTWSFTATGLQTGNNTIQVKAVDNEGAESSVATRTVIRALVDVEPNDFFVLTQFQDIWLSANAIGTYTTPFRMNGVGFEYFIPENKKTMAVDFDADGDTDFLYVNPRGELWLSRNTLNLIARGEAAALTPTVKLSQGWDFDASNNEEVFAGDFDNDGLADVVHLSGNGTARIAYGDGSSIGAPGTAVSTGLTLEPGIGINVFAVDMDGDGGTDLVELNNSTGAVRVASGTGSGFSSPSSLGATGFSHDPDNNVGVHFGDFNNDGLMDIAQVDDNGDVTAILQDAGVFISVDAVNSSLSYRDDPDRGKGWWVFAADADGDRRDDLVQLNEFGEVWVASSNGNGSFAAPVKNAALGFEHRPQGRWQVFVGNPN